MSDGIGNEWYREGMAEAVEDIKGTVSVGDEIEDPTYHNTVYVIAVEEDGIRVSNTPPGGGGGSRFVRWRSLL